LRPYLLLDEIVDIVHLSFKDRNGCEKLISTKPVHFYALLLVGVFRLRQQFRQKIRSWCVHRYFPFLPTAAAIAAMAASRATRTARHVLIVM
jgi:hypothetical protein